VKPAASLLPLLLLSACANPSLKVPSLAARPAEAIDPRLPVPDLSGEIPLDPALAERLQALVRQAQSTQGPFDAAILQAERAAAAAGSKDSESWIAAQQALSAAIGARYPTTRALGDVDALSAARLKERGFIAPRDLAAIRDAAEVIAAIDQRQASRVDAVQGRLGG